MIPFSGLSRFSGHFGGDGPSPLNRDTTVIIISVIHLPHPEVYSVLMSRLITSKIAKKNLPRLSLKSLILTCHRCQFPLEC